MVEQGQRPEVEYRLQVEVPAQIYAWKASPADREKAKAVQSRNRDLFQRAFRDGLAALGYERDAEGNGRFLIGRWDENWSYASHE